MSQPQTASSLEYRVGDQPVPGYTLVRELGRGAMGVVWLAQTDSGFERALKVINLTQRGGKKEYRGLRTIKQRKLLHGNLLTLIDYWLKGRDGNFIQDSDQLDATDSFFAPPSDKQPRTGSLAATTPQSMGTTDTDRGGTVADVSPAAPKASVHRAVTMVASATIVSTEPEAPPVDKLGSTTDVGDSPLPQAPRRPVQLIVAMELGHKTLDDRQKQLQEDHVSGIPADELVAYMEQAARGLDYLHREGIIHRDIKPQNIMLVGDVAKVCDYGLVVSADADLRATSNAFTPLYASPEAVSDKVLTGQSDQYSLAVTYIELRTGHTPYASETAASVYAAKETGKYDLSRIRNTAVRNVLKRALNRTPNERFGTCSQFIKELEKAEHSGSAKTWLMAGVAAMLLLAIGGSLAVPQMRDGLLAIVGRPKGGGTNGTNKDSNSTGKNTDEAGKDEAQTPPPPPPPPEMRKVVDEARALRLAGNLEEAAAKLDELKLAAEDSEPRHWPYHLERLHLDISRHADAPSAVASSQWEAWRQTVEQLVPRARGQIAEQLELAALQLFIATRLDPASLALEMPLADEFGRLSSGKEQWAKVLSAAEQARVQSLFDALKRRIIASREPLPPAWKRRFGEIWPAPAGAQILIDRARERIVEGSTAGLVGVAADITDLDGQVSAGLTPAVKTQLDAVRLEVKQAQNKLLIESLARYLTNDDSLANADARKQLLTYIQSLGDTSELPLAALLRIEAEMAEHDAADKRYPMELADELSELSTRLSNATEPPLGDWRDYARFLFMRADRSSLSGGAAAPESSPQIELLLQWPESATADWHTPRRKQQAADILVRLADSPLPLTNKDALRFQELQRELAPQATAAARYLDKARRLGCDSAYCHGLSALALGLLARQPDMASWAAVAEAADRALANWSNVADPAQQSRKPAIEYVSALAAARMRDAAAAGRNRAAIGTLASLLKELFRDDTSRNANDRGMLENVVLPALAIPAQDSSDVAVDLATLWAAKGRLIERNPTNVFLSIEGVNPVEHTDDYARAMLTAHEAYTHASALDDTVTAAGGSARTLLKLPRELFDWHKYEGELAQLVERHRQAATDDASLLFADACVLRRRAFLTPERIQKLRMAEQAIERFDKVGLATRSADPYAIRGVTLCAASDTYLKAAFWTPIAASDEAKNATATNTKFYFLTKALETASAAAADQNLLLPEEARTARGNAMEDLAFYYKETDNYQRAVAAFRDGIGQIDRRRSKAYAMMSLGRCQYRWAMDAVRIDANPEERVKHLREAFVSLSDALAHAQSREPSVVPEASFWRATVIWESALEGPGDLTAPMDESRAGFRSGSIVELRRVLGDPNRKEDAAKELAARLSQMEAARQEIVKAAQEARVHSAVEWSHYLPTAAFLGRKLYEDVRLLQNSVTIALAPTAILEEVRQQVEELLAFAGKQPGALSANERRSLIDLMVRLGQAQPGWTPQKAAQTIGDYENVLADDNDDARAQLVLLKLVKASYQAAPDYSEAEQLASRITSPSLAAWARGYCERFKADLLLRPLRDKLEAYLRDPETSKALTLADDAKLQSIQTVYAAAVESLVKSSDPRTIENVARLCAAPIAEIESGRWQAGMTNLEVELLRQNITLETEAVRIQLFKLLDARISLHRDTWKLKDMKQAPEEFRQVIRQTLDCLKPIRFLEVRYSVVKLDDYLRDFLRLCEARQAKS